MFSDPILQKLVKKYPKPTFSDRSPYLFEDLVESIISQQLSIKASGTIFTRFKALFKTKKFPSPKDLLKKRDDELRTAGISYQKISYLKSVADAFVSDLINIKIIGQMSDEEVITTLTQIRGVGKWTAEMILIFTLARPDVFSVGDLGIRNAIERLYGIKEKDKMLALSEKWKPYRSSACWYLWRSLENK